MEPLNIQITDLSLDTAIGVTYHDGPLTLADAIVNAAVTRLAKEDEYRELSNGLRKRVNVIRDEEIRALVKAELAEAMAAPVTATNQWGEATGKTTTLRALILEHAQKFFTEKKSTDSFHRGPSTTDAERVVAALVKDELTKGIAAVFAEEKVKVVKLVQAKAAELLAQAVKDGLR